MFKTKVILKETLFHFFINDKEISREEFNAIFEDIEHYKQVSYVPIVDKEGNFWRYYILEKITNNS